MEQVVRLEKPLPRGAAPAVAVASELHRAGHVALLAGGCVRDLLIGREPEDYDVATNAIPDRVCQIFRKTRKVGAQFGVVLVRKSNRWVEVATFRSDIGYSDGRRPDAVVFGEAREDALRRDFTINGMFLDPESAEILDYVNGRGDLAARLVRAIGEPRARFEEDHLRLIRAVRFASRLEFEIEHETMAAIRSAASKLARVAPERVREELERMLANPTRARAFELLRAGGLLPFLWKGANWSDQSAAAARDSLGRLPPGAGFEASVATLLSAAPAGELESICRSLAFSNDQREDVVWLVTHEEDLDDPSAIELAELKRLMAHRAFGALMDVMAARYSGLSDGPSRSTSLTTRLQSIPSESVQPSPLITGDDLKDRDVPPGPIYKRILDELYTSQLNEELNSREEAEQRLITLLRDLN